MGGSCWVFRAERSCRVEDVESAVWAKEKVASNKATARSKIRVFKICLLSRQGIFRRDERRFVPSPEII